MTIRLIALDIDDTLLDSHHRILPSTQTAVAACLARGIKVVLTSGRPLAGIAPFMAALGIQGPDQYAVTNNGAVVVTAAGAVIGRRLVDNAGYRRMTALAKTLAVPFNVVAEDSTIITADCDVDATIVQQAAENAAGLLIREPGELPADFAVTKGLFVGAKTRLDAAAPQIEAALAADYSVLRAGPSFLEVMAQGVDKAAGLRQLATRLAISPADMMAFGDEGNDLAMFKLVGLAVCMQNGSDMAKAHADFVTASNDDDGIAKALTRFVLNDAEVAR
ncbi:Cof-type HAD-IIB family hydrolase [Lacticaseibacillus parakribbianus]|uniref:Cof-type HAD-IIB family hydrolase n=1 Tax=Lacticaseibacillus parakribbianus TaxID=2970927 RepID=UPI0021CB2A88|nr:Cof-type HAD-IIB family hydrolase [Lacticaseibacillus parakribbianus]